MITARFVCLLGEEVGRNWVRVVGAVGMGIVVRPHGRTSRPCHHAGWLKGGSADCDCECPVAARVTAGVLYEAGVLWARGVRA